MKQYEDQQTGAIKYDFYFSDKQIKTGYEENGEKIPFSHTQIKDKKTGEPLLMYRISLRDAQNRDFRFKNEKLNTSPCFIQIPADSVKRKIKGLTSVYTVTMPIKEKWRVVVYSGDINAKEGWRGPSEKIGLDELSKCLEYQEHDHKKDKNPAADIDRFFPKGGKEDPVKDDTRLDEAEAGSQNPASETNIEQSAEPETHGSSALERIARLEAVVLAQQNEIESLKNQLSSVTKIAASLDQRTESFGETLGQISQDHKALMNIYSRIKDWSRNMLSKYTNLEYTVDTVKLEVTRIADLMSEKSRTPKLSHKNR